MSALTPHLNRFKVAGRRASNTRTEKQLEAVAKIDMAHAIFEAGRKLVGPIRQIMLSNYRRSGLRPRSGTMESGIARAVINIQPPGRIFIQLPSGMAYPNGKGDPYAAAGVFRYGGVRQPLIHKKGDLYKDLPTGEMRPRKFAAGALGAKLKRSLKASVLKTGKADSLGKSRDAYERAQEKVRKKLGRTIDVGAGITVMKPKPPFFLLTEDDRERIATAWAALVKAELRKRGVEAK